MPVALDEEDGGIRDAPVDATLECGIRRQPRADLGQCCGDPHAQGASGSSSARRSPVFAVFHARRHAHARAVEDRALGVLEAPDRGRIVCWRLSASRAR